MDPRTISGERTSNKPLAAGAVQATGASTPADIPTDGAQSLLPPPVQSAAPVRATEAGQSALPGWMLNPDKAVPQSKSGSEMEALGYTFNTAAGKWEMGVGSGQYYREKSGGGVKIGETGFGSSTNTIFDTWAPGTAAPSLDPLHPNYKFAAKKAGEYGWTPDMENKVVPQIDPETGKVRSYGETMTAPIYLKNISDQVSFSTMTALKSAFPMAGKDLLDFISGKTTGISGSLDQIGPEWKDARGNMRWVELWDFVKRTKEENSKGWINPGTEWTDSPSYPGGKQGKQGKNTIVRQADGSLLIITPDGKTERPTYKVFQNIGA